MTISDKIRKQLEQPDGLTIEALSPLAVEYGRETEQVNTRLAECTQLLRKGLRSEAIQRAFMKPNLLDWSASLDFSEFDDWLSILQFYGIAVPTLLNRDAAQELQEAIVEEQPLEELLRQHRRLAIAKAPLAWRLKVLRRLGQVDPANIVWREDQEQWETIRLKQIPSELKAAVDAKLLVAVQSICEELNESKWAVAPPQELCKRASKAARIFRHEEQTVQLRAIADQLHSAYSEGNESAASSRFKAWNEVVRGMESPPDSELVQSVEPAIEWLRECEEDRARIARHEKATANLEVVLQRKSTLADVQRSHYEVTSLQMGIDPILEQRYHSRVNELQQASKRRLQLSIAAIAVSAITLMTALGMWQWNRTYRKAVDDSSARLTALIDADELDEADSIAKKLNTQAPQIANSPELAALFGKLKSAQQAESSRAERAAAAIAAAQNDDPAKIDLGNLISAEKQAKTPDEKAQIQIVRRAWERHEQEITTNQFEIVRTRVSTIEERLAEIQKSQIADVSESELQNIMTDLNKITAEFPRGSSRASKLLEVASERTTSLRDSIRKQRRDMEIRQQATKGIREAKSLEQFQNEMKRFAEKLPGDPVATEYSDALQEAELWKRADDWNVWCKSLGESLEGGLSQTELKSLVDAKTSLVSALLEIPNTSIGFKFLSDHLAIADQRSTELTSLLEDFENAVIADLVTISEMAGSDARVGSRRFMTWDARAENDAAIKKLGTKPKIVLPVISDNLGATTNVTFTGKISILEEPRSTIRKMIRRMESNKQSVVDDWESGIIAAIKDVVQGKELDSQIKEILLTRLVKAGGEGSIAMKVAFSALEEKLRDRADKRAFWFNSSEMNANMDNEVLACIKECLKELESQKLKLSESLKRLAGSNFEWIGAMMRDSTGKLDAWLNRDDVPDGDVVCIVPAVQPANAGRVVQVGRVAGKKLSFSGSSETSLAGRPLFLICTSKTNSN